MYPTVRASFVRAIKELTHYFFLSGSKEECGEDDDMFYLWSASPRGRAARTHAYRASGSPMEVSTRCSRGAQSPVLPTPEWSQRLVFTQKSRAYACGYFRCGGGRGEAEEGGRGRAIAEKGEGESRLGRSYRFESQHPRQILNKRQLRRANCCYSQSQGSWTVRHILLTHFSMLIFVISRQEANAIGPGIGPAAIPSLPPAPSSLPQPPMQGSSDPAYSAATVSSGPQPASLYPQQPPPVMLPPLHYQGLDAAQPFGYQPPAAPMMHPSRMAGMMQPPAQTGMVRSAEEMEGTADDGMPPAKRQKVAKLPAGQYYPEQDWINMHPVRFFSF